MSSHSVDPFWTPAALSPAADVVEHAVVRPEPAEPESTVSPAWLAAAKQGESAACQRLVEHLYPTVIRIIRSHLPARMDEEDLAQEVFMKMFQKLDQFRGEQRIEHWVAKITTNTCLDALRKQKVRPEIRFADLSHPEQAILLEARGQIAEFEAPSVEDQADGTMVVDKILAYLKPDQQMVVRMLNIDGQSVKEICNQTGWSASKVKVTAMRARKHLAEVLGRLGKSILS